MARALFEEGLELGEQENWEQAVDRFTRAYELHASPGIAVNLASALIPLGELVEASEILQGLLESPDTPQRVTGLAESLLRDEIEPNVAELTIHVTGNAEDVEVLRDGERVPPAIYDIAVPANPGHTLVTAERDGEAVARQELEIEPGGHAEVTLDLAVVPSARETAERANQPDEHSPEPLEEESGSIIQKWWFWTGLLLVAGAITAVVLAVTLSGEQVASPVEGTTNPPFLEGMVMP